MKPDFKRMLLLATIAAVVVYIVKSLPRKTTKDAQPGTVNGVPIDRYTFGHFGAGLALRSFGVNPLAVVALAIGWEFLEDQLKNQIPKVFPNPSHDSPANSSIDAAAVVLGYALL